MAPKSLDQLSPQEDDALLAKLREKESHLSFTLRLLSMIGALAFVMLGLVSSLMPLLQPAPPPKTPQRSGLPQA